jgi:hypothetical protein
VQERRAPRKALLVALSAGLWACGLSAVGSKVDDAGTGDAASSEASAADVPSSDASVNDALVDAEAAPDGPVTFCTTVSPPPTFCADFDDPAASGPSAGWENLSLEAGTSVVSSTTVYSTAPRSLQATSTLGYSAVVEKQLPMTSRISVDFDVRYPTLPVTGVVSAIRLTPPIYPGMDVYFFARTTNSYFQEYGDDYSAFLPAPSLDTWHHVAITITTTGLSSMIDASVDGIVGWKNHTLLHPWPSPTIATLQVGLANLYAVTSGEAFVDNVVVRTQ